MKRYRKQAKIAMAIALTTSSLASSMPTIAAKEEVNMQENDFENKNEVLETEVLSTEKEDTSVEEIIPEIKNEEKYQSMEKEDGDVILNEQYFPDAGFREFIKEAASLNDNDVLTEEKRNQITEISIQGDENNPRSDVRSLEGIQYFPNLERLDCAYQTELTGTLDLTSHKNLQVVRVRNTKVEGIDVTGLTNLAAISIAHTNIGGELDLRTNTGLQRIYAFNTVLTGLKVDGLTNLRSFDISNSLQLEGEFDLSTNPNLEWVTVNKTKTSGINVTGLTNLQTLSVSHSNVTGELDLRTNTGLQKFNATNSLLTGLQVDGLTNLVSFDVSNSSQLEGEFDLSTNPGLEWVTVNSTKTSGINISGLTNLSVFSIAHTDVTGELDFSGNTALTELYVNNTKITSLNIDGMTNLKVFDVSGNPDLEGQFDLRANKALEVVNINTTKISGVDVTGLDKVRTLSIYNSNINKALDLRTNTALKNLYASNSQITDLNIDGLTNLVYIDISNNKELVCELDLRGNPNLEVVYALSTKVSSIDITGLAKLKTFSIHNTNISQDYDFTSNPALEYISINNLNIHNINVQGLSNLTTLYAGNTKITSLDVSTNPNLQLLHCNTNLTWLNIGNNPNLTTLKKGNSVIDLGQIGDSFHITKVTEAFKGIDPSKVTMVSGATYDETTGEVSGYQNGTPIVYRYDSGTMANNQAVSLEVTLNFTTGLAASTISINNYEGKVYDGTPVSKPSNITAIGSSGAVTFEWFKQDENGQWVSLGDQAPVNAGSYGVKAHLAADANYEAADSGEPVAFTIAKAETKVSIEGKLNKEYDGKEVEVPTIKVEGNTGLVTIEWYQKGVSRAWELIPGAPKEVGEYKIVVKVEEDENYLGVEVGQTFAILEKGEVPSTPEEGEDNTTTEEEKVEGVQTGDVSQTSMWTMLVGLSMSMMYFLKRKKKG